MTKQISNHVHARAVLAQDASKAMTECMSADLIGVLDTSFTSQSLERLVEVVGINLAALSACKQVVTISRPAICFALGANVKVDSFNRFRIQEHHALLVTLTSDDDLIANAVTILLVAKTGKLAHTHTSCAERVQHCLLTIA